MPEFLTAAEITDLGGLLAPGIVITWIRGRFNSAAQPEISKMFFSYAIVSVAYNAVAYPIFHDSSGLQLSGWLWASLFRFLVPLIVAAALVLFDRSEKFYKWTEKIGLRPVHHTPTAWEYTFPKSSAVLCIGAFV